MNNLSNRQHFNSKFLTKGLIVGIILGLIFVVTICSGCSSNETSSQSNATSLQSQDTNSPYPLALEKELAYNFVEIPNTHREVKYALHNALIAKVADVNIGCCYWAYYFDARGCWVTPCYINGNTVETIPLEQVQKLVKEHKFPSSSGNN